MRRKALLVSGTIGAISLVVLGACATEEKEPVSLQEDSMGIRVTSSTFSEGSNIPIRYACDGEDVSPLLSWSGVPDGTKSIALIADDPDAPGRTFVHWVVYSVPASATGLPEGVSAEAERHMERVATTSDGGDTVARVPRPAIRTATFERCTRWTASRA